MTDEELSKRPRDSMQPVHSERPVPSIEKVIGASEDQISIAEQIAVPGHAAVPEVIVSQEIESVIQQQVPSEPIPHISKIT